MPDIRTLFSADIDHRAGIAAVFRTKVVGDGLVLTHKLGISHKYLWAADRIVVVVLPVNLLVIVSSAQSVDRKPYAVGIGETQVAGHTHTGK